jgi:hypothetical protein
MDQTEFVVHKRKDRGTDQAFGTITNAQDFMRLLRLELAARIAPSTSEGARRPGPPRRRAGR